MKVTIDGQPFQSTTSGINSMPDLIELIKASIDPDMIITGLYIGERPLADVDWRVPLTVQGDVTLEVTTDTQQNYVNGRLSQADEIIQVVAGEFTNARELFQAGKSDDGNRMLSRAVQDLKAFLAWYDGILKLVTTGTSTKQEFDIQIAELCRTCEQLLQQQLYHSWWALGETIRQDLEPKLTDLRAVAASLAGSQPAGL